jgi:predicted AAA+ superfamily ATPase
MTVIPRTAMAALLNWRKAPRRKVLLVRGARQVGKTYLVREFAKQFRSVLEINFLEDKQAHHFFSGDLRASGLIEQLQAYYNVPIIDDETLLFFDEVQECPNALTALRFFHEQRPDLHVIAAGSLLEFALSEIPSFGVGRIQSLFIHPVSFDEYLQAAGEERLYRYLRRAGPEPIANPLHEKLISQLKKFLFHGGLPEVVSHFLEERNYQDANELIDHLRRSFEDDFPKYRKRVPADRLSNIFRSAALQAGKKFIHSHAYPDAQAGPVHQAIELLERAAIIERVYHTAANGIPLGGEVDTKKYKTFPFDHGIYQRMIGVTPAEFIVKDFNPINKGAMAEVYVGCALRGASASSLREPLYYWHREAKSSNAEVDYVVQCKEQIVPIEVKSGTRGKMQSIRAFLDEKQHTKRSPLGVRVSLENFGRVDNILIVPLYAVSQIWRLVEEVG